MLNDFKRIWLPQNIHVALSIKEHKRTKTRGETNKKKKSKVALMTKVINFFKNNY